MKKKSLVMRIIYEPNPDCICGENHKPHYIIQVKILFIWCLLIDSKKNPIYLSSPLQAYESIDDIYLIKERLKQIVYQAIANVLILIMAVFLGGYFYE